MATDIKMMFLLKLCPIKSHVCTWSQEQVDPGAWQFQSEPLQHRFICLAAQRPASSGPCIRPVRPYYAIN